MSYKIFESYKYVDTQVFHDSGFRKNQDRWNACKKITLRDYLNALSSRLSDKEVDYLLKHSEVDVVGTDSYGIDRNGYILG